VRERIEDKVDNMLICQSIQHMFAIAATREQIFASQHAQPLGDRGHLIALAFSQL
jgi:hypothetical protein